MSFAEIESPSEGPTVSARRKGAGLSLVMRASVVEAPEDILDQQTELLQGFAVDIDDLPKLYFKDIGKVPLLTAEEEVELAQRMEAGLYAGKILSGELGTEVDPPPTEDELAQLVEGGEAAWERFMTANLRLVVHTAQRYNTKDGLMDMMDNISEGNLGLDRAVRKFDYKLGYKFSTYAQTWIRKFIRGARIDQNSDIRTPVHVPELLAKLHKSQDSLTQTLGREPTDDELTADLNWSSAKLTTYQQLQHSPVLKPIKRLNAPVSEDGDELGNFIPDDMSLNPAEMASDASYRQLLRHSVYARLDPLEASVIDMFYGLTTGEPLNGREVSRCLGRPTTTIMTIKGKALSKLRHMTELATE
ncbi:MAG TPA: sigma-70 family RNA polymerase sigma factor [Candidatus Saccharimonadales bacterium]|jgi:RNA polymerase primary sigma factor